MFIYSIYYNHVTMNSKFAILGLVVAAALVATIAVPNAFALTQSSSQSSGQGSSQSQTGVSVLSPQTSAQVSGQSSIQAACILLNAGCG